MRTYSRYADQYLKKKQQQDPNASKSRLISQINDSSPDPYQQFLEVQLEKVTNALLMTKDYESRLESLEKTQVIFEEKIAKFMSMTKLLQTFAEAQEKENQKYEAKIEENAKEWTEIKEKTEVFQKNVQRTEGKIEALASNFEKLSEKEEFEDIIRNFRQEINKKIELVMLETQKSALNSDLEQLQATLDQEKHERESILNEMMKDLAAKEQNSQEIFGGDEKTLLKIHFFF